MIRIAITGPESCGKSTLAKDLTGALKGILVEEYARNYLEEKKGNYDQDDILTIARVQKRMIDEAQSPFVICDTAFLVLKIWSEEKFGYVNSEIESFLDSTRFDLIVLCAPDVPWEPDPLRENPHDRDRLYQIYLRYLQDSKFKFIEARGSREERLKKTLQLIREL